MEGGRAVGTVDGADKKSQGERGCLYRGVKVLWREKMRVEVAKRRANLGNDREGKHVPCELGGWSKETLVTVEEGERKVMMRQRKGTKRRMIL